MANVEKLAPVFDFVELLLFESFSEDSFLPSPQIDFLQALSCSENLAYNIHLPIDICLGHPVKSRHDYAKKTILDMMRLYNQLNPTYTLHLPLPDNMGTMPPKQDWLKRIRDSILLFLDTGLPSRNLCIENLDYPIEWIADLVYDLNLSICLDVGHLILSGGKVKPVYDKFKKIITMIHLHGVKDGKDHYALDELEPNDLNKMMTILQEYTHCVCLEVFSYERLCQSIETLAGYFIK